MRKLYYISIVHNRADLGSMGSELSSEGEKKYGSELWKKHLIEVDKSWNKIETKLLKIKKIDQIYQDGLPIIGEIGLKIIKDVAEKGSKNYQIIEKLLDKGAIIEQAESKELLLKEYNLILDITKAESKEEKLKTSILYQNESLKLLNDRDEFIANQINTTLDGIGVAFFGTAHSIIDKLDKNIKIIEINFFNDEISLNLCYGKR
jgi:hypothetical protein